MKTLHAFADIGYREVEMLRSQVAPLASYLGDWQACGQSVCTSRLRFLQEIGEALETRRNASC